MSSNMNMPAGSRDIVDQDRRQALQDNILLDSNQVQIIKELSLENSMLKVTLYRM